MAAAIDLPDYRNGEPFWPKCAALTHAIELSLAFHHHHPIEAGKSPPGKDPHNHDLVGWQTAKV
jgi:hypothetical protein